MIRGPAENAGAATLRRPTIVIGAKSHTHDAIAQLDERNFALEHDVEMTAHAFEIAQEIAEIENRSSTCLRETALARWCQRRKAARS
jgi:hypothetical protein